MEGKQRRACVRDSSVLVLLVSHETGLSVVSGPAGAPATSFGSRKPVDLSNPNRAAHGAGKMNRQPSLQLFLPN